ncbi:acyltransferase [Tropicibacter sp. Alg240-R139]|uniref:acyltransferase family protein n=1 Tax=Tropicibacter sp. Alg240-R139 TaxID=2305991 RepID=UPI0013DE8C49|nr:acyltransferase [Tropicibacter sp. Alg240-R139]
MNPGFSTYLNLLRFGAAMVVLLSHFAYPRFSGGDWMWVRELNLGSDAVVIFFVLSGFVIALTAESKDDTIGRFAFSRLSRLISVALPALVLTWILDQMGSSVDPSSYFAPYFAPLPLWEMLARGLSFSNEWSGLSARLGSNGPFWSLSYEAAYYALFAVCFYLSGLRRAALLVLFCLLFGLNVLLLMPAWLMGVWLYRNLHRIDDLSPQALMLLTLAPVAVYSLSLAIDLPNILQVNMQPVFGGHDLRFSDEYLWNAVLGGLTTLHLLGAAGLARHADLTRLARPANWCAGGSFSLYLVHYPVLQWLDASLPALSNLGLLTGTIVICFGFAAVFERPLPAMRRWVLNAAYHIRSSNRDLTKPLGPSM